MLLQALTILLAIFLILVVLRASTGLADSFEKYKKLPLALTIFIGLWLIYLSGLSYFEVLVDFSFPPKMPLLVVMPLMVLIIISLFRNVTSDFGVTTAVSWLIYIQSFRIIVELIIWGGYLEGIIPIDATFEGSNFDVVVGITAVPMAYYAKREKVSNTALIIWNIAGLLILAYTVRMFITAGYFPEVLGESSAMIGPAFVKMPYLLIAGLFMPLAVLIHALSIKQLLNIRKR
jgi:hypothetical protein